VKEESARRPRREELHPLGKKPSGTQVIGNDHKPQTAAPGREVGRKGSTKFIAEEGNLLRGAFSRGAVEIPSTRSVGRGTLGDPVGKVKEDRRTFAG